MAAFIANQGSGRPPNTAYADVVIKNDGTIHLFIGVVDIGAGQQTIFSMIAAEELGVNFEDIIPMAGTRRIPDTVRPPIPQGSRRRWGLPCCRQPQKRERSFSRWPLPCWKWRRRSSNPNTVISIRKSDPAPILSPYKEVCSNIDPQRPIRGRGSRATNPDDPMFATFGAQAAEVEVDLRQER